jgi:hypothetical protein
MFSFYQIHPTSINKTDGASSSEDGITADVRTTTTSWTQCDVSRFLPIFKTIENAQPRSPPNGFISSFLVLLATVGIIVILTRIKCHHILKLEPSSASEGVTDCASEGIVDCTSISFKGDDIFSCSTHSEADYSLNFEREYNHDLLNSLEPLSGFTTSFADADSEKMNTQIHFDTDSIFFVCNNSMTSHICNDMRKFIPGSLWQSNKSLTMANGTGPCLQEGTVWLQLIDNIGMKHTFILENCLFHPSSLVYLLSTR